MPYKWVIIILASSLEMTLAIDYNPKPNIIFILADDMGWNDVSFHGSPQIPTPNIDALAASGIVFENYYTQPLCTPSRAALMTGKYPIHLGMQHDIIYAGEPRGLNWSEEILPQFLKQLGYKTYGVGKWHLGYCKKAYLPTNRGFDTFFGFWNGKIDYYDHTNFESSNSTLFFGYDLHDGEEPAKECRGKYLTDLLTEKAVGIIRNHDPIEPLFLYFAHVAPHVGNSYQPLQAPYEHIAKHSYIKDKKRRQYAGVMSKLDESIGIIYEVLAEKGMLDNTLLIFTSDNGAPVEGFTGAYGSNWPLRGLKTQTFEGGTRVPTVLWSPWLKLTKPTISHQLMHVTDWLPTLYEAAGGNAKDLGPIDGISMWKHLLYDVPGPRTEVLINIDPIYNQAAVIHENFKIVIENVGAEFYNFFDDPPSDVHNQWYGPSGREFRVNSMDDWVWKEGSIIRDILQANGRWLIKEPNRWRSGLTVSCGLKRFFHKSDNTTGPRLFDLKSDPCEYNNLGTKYPDLLEKLRIKLQLYNETAIGPIFKPLDPHSDPRCFNFKYVPWLEDEYRSSCSYG